MMYTLRARIICDSVRVCTHYSHLIAMANLNDVTPPGNVGCLMLFAVPQSPSPAKYSESGLHMSSPGPFLYNHTTHTTPRSEDS
jgi:hypothetical protein